VEKKSQLPAQLNQEESQSPFFLIVSLIATVYLDKRKHIASGSAGMCRSKLHSSFLFQLQNFLQDIPEVTVYNLHSHASECARLLPCIFHHMGRRTQLHLLHQRLHVAKCYIQPCSKVSAKH